MTYDKKKSFKRLFVSRIQGVVKDVLIESCYSFEHVRADPVWFLF